MQKLSIYIDCIYESWSSIEYTTFNGKSLPIKSEKKCGDRCRKIVSFVANDVMALEWRHL